MNKLILCCVLLLSSCSKDTEYKSEGLANVIKDCPVGATAEITVQIGTLSHIVTKCTWIVKEK